MAEAVGDPGAVACTCRRPRIRLDRISVSGRTELLLCAYCDTGNGQPTSGPPILLDYLRKGHQ